MDISNFGSSTYSWPKNTSEKIAELSICRHGICNEDKTVIANQHNKGKLTARERIDFLLDPGTFEELGAFVSHDHGKSPSCVITGYGQIEGRPVYVISQNSSTSNIFRAEIYSKKICYIIDLSLKNGCPIVSLNDFGESGSQCIGEETIGTFAEIFLRSTLASGVVPQVSAIMGPYLGHVAFTSAISDFTFMVQQSSYMSLTNPRFHNSAPLEGVAVEEFGEASAHAKKSGMAHFICLNDLDCIRKIRHLLSFVSANNLEESPRVLPIDSPGRIEESLNAIIPDHPRKSYDMKELIRYIVDDGEFCEVQEQFAANILVGFARLNGLSIGIVAQQPKVLAGVLDVDASNKAARFIRFCDCFNIPLLTVMDVPGFLPGIQQERHGIIRHGAKLVYAYCEATVPKLTVITRKAYGGAYVMGSKHMRGDVNYAWPTAEIAVMGAEGAVNILFKKEISEAQDPDKRRQELTAEYSEKFATPYAASHRGYIDEIIEPCQTRAKLITALDSLKNKRDANPQKKHDNIPL